MNDNAMAAKRLEQFLDQLLRVNSIQRQAVVAINELEDIELE